MPIFMLMAFSEHKPVKYKAVLISESTQQLSELSHLIFLCLLHSI